jgi:rare lipoprotein A
MGPAAFGRRTACGSVIRPETEGVAHPTLPCGVRIFITYRGTTVLTQVIDRGPYVPGRQFDVTDALARRLGLRNVQTIHWSYARTA